MKGKALITVSDKDKSILRTLGEAIYEIAHRPVMTERKRLWKKLNALDAERPMIVVESGGIINEAVPEKDLLCESEWARGVERALKLRIYHFNHVDDDTIIEPRMTYSCVVNVSDNGFKIERRFGDSGAGLGSYTWQPPITDIGEGLQNLHYKTLSIDEERTKAGEQLVREVFGDVLPIERRGMYWWTHGLSIDAIDFLGLEGFMLAMYDQPEQLHNLMGFLRDDRLNTLKWFEDKGILLPNNEDDYIGSGGCGYTDLLPSKDYNPEKGATLKDMWGLAESQETVGVSPDKFEEFVFQYQLPIISKFGLACYGCCEPLENRWHIVKRIPNLRRVSVSPWANQEKMADYLGKNYVYSRKPNPSNISMSMWNEEILREDIRNTLQITKGLNIELVMKDVHTLSGEPWRLGRWVQIAREEIERIYH